MVTYQYFFSGVGVSLRLSLLHYFFAVQDVSAYEETSRMLINISQKD